MEQQISYNKLVRDNIPQIIESQGKTAVVRRLLGEEYRAALEEKLREEVTEYLEARDPEEICDILEVLYAILDLEGISREEIERRRQEKSKRNGAFREQLLLQVVYSNQNMQTEPVKNTSV